MHNLTHIFMILNSEDIVLMCKPLLSKTSATQILIFVGFFKQNSGLAKHNCHTHYAVSFDT